MSPHTRKKTPKTKQTNSPSTRHKKVKHESPSSSEEPKKPELIFTSQEVTETQKMSKSGDSNVESSLKYGFETPETKGISQEFEKCERTKRTCSPSFEVKKPKLIASSEKADKCGYSTQAGSSSFEIKKERNKALSKHTRGCTNLEMIDISQYQVTDLQLEKCQSTGRIGPSSVAHEKPGVSFEKPEHSVHVSAEESHLREFKRLQQRCLELDNEREALTLAIGKEMGLTANMQKLHEYNSIKDITQTVIGSLSNILNIPVTQLHQELNLTFEK